MPPRLECLDEIAANRTKAAGDETGGASGDETAGGTGEPAAAAVQALTRRIEAALKVLKDKTPPGDQQTPVDVITK